MPSYPSQASDIFLCSEDFQVYPVTLLSCKYEFAPTVHVDLEALETQELNLFPLLYFHLSPSPTPRSDYSLHGNWSDFFFFLSINWVWGFLLRIHWLLCNQCVLYLFFQVFTWLLPQVMVQISLPRGLPDHLSKNSTALCHGSVPQLSSNHSGSPHSLFFSLHTSLCKIILFICLSVSLL